ncbi:ATP-grasp domain-containing protein [Streptomyces albus subsp. chlorinus]|uniref:ATP-grasp domain-containing protein n=1 Tax=Streptomyces albus TaxID=1888 RepID=UPI00156D60CA|nr:ATP-grasp domain-containing protein [Streptomyces albus]NSC20064.1 ATP-grasp domain-containing protein [Streptomyces albus subsp. chlorinus]
MPTVIVIGYREDLDRALQRRGLEPYYLVQSSMGEPKGRRFSRVTDMENAQEILRAVLAARIGEVAGVLTVHEMGVFGAAYLRRELKLPGHSDPQATLCFRDKYLQKSKLPPHIRRARCRYATKDTTFAELARELGEVFVVKPATGAGSLRTSIVRSPDEYARALRPLSVQSDVEVVAESFIDAPEIYVDGVWQDGALRWSSIGRYQLSPLGAVQGGILAAHVLDRRRHPALFEEATTLVEQALFGLEAPDCVFHLEAFAEEAGLTFGECAMRLPGALSPKVNELTFGVDLLDVEISLALGEELTQPLESEAPDRFYGFLLLRRPKAGTLTQEDFERNFAFDEIEYDSSPGAPVGPYGRVGQAIVSDTDELRLEKTLGEIVRFNESG